MPIYIVGLISTLLMSWAADRRQRRWPFVVIPYSVSLVGAIALMAIPHPRYPGLTYAFLFTIPAGVFPAIISAVTWVSNNLSPTWKRSTGIALAITLANLGGAIGSNIYLVEEAPHYWTGYGVSVAVLVMAITSTLVLRFAYNRINKARDRMSEEEIRSRYTDREYFQPWQVHLKILSTLTHKKGNYLSWEMVLPCTGMSCERKGFRFMTMGLLCSNCKFISLLWNKDFPNSQASFNFSIMPVPQDIS